ncbi:MAG: helix-turn-helix transcriptional regulator [Cycloclasticus sp.]|nr:helix-turn-helix transcriptional regulator [Cycloclasticus sp.]
MKIVNLLKELRKNYRSESAMARDLGMSRQAVSDLTEELHHPKDETIMVICKKMNVDPKQLLIETAAARSSGEAKENWKEILKKYESVAASILAAPALFSFYNGIECILC